MTGVSDGNFTRSKVIEVWNNVHGTCYLPCESIICDDEMAVPSIKAGWSCHWDNSMSSSTRNPKYNSLFQINLIYKSDEVLKRNFNIFISNCLNETGEPVLYVRTSFHHESDVKGHLCNDLYMAYPLSEVNFSSYFNPPKASFFIFFLDNHMIRKIFKCIYKQVRYITWRNTKTSYLVDIRHQLACNGEDGEQIDQRVLRQGYVT